MKNPKNGFSRKDLLASVGALTMAGFLDPATAMAAAVTPAAETPAPPVGVHPDTVSSKQLVYSLEQAYGKDVGLRRNHTKGIGVSGFFVGTPEAAEYSRSPLFSGNKIEVVGRFSIAGGDLHASDKEKSPRGLGMQFRLPDGSLQHMTMLHTPMFFAAVPRTFYDKFIALTPDPATGKPNPAQYKAWAASHPDATAQNTFLAENNPPVSYANSAFYSIHTFKFINRDNEITMVRWRFVPQDGQKQLTDAELKSFSENFYEAALIRRMKQGPANWDMIVTIGEPGDPVEDPTVLWPANRKEFKAGTLTLTSATRERDAGSYFINFDPLVMGDGIAATNDPILLARSAAYGVSYSKRLRERKTSALE